MAGEVFNRKGNTSFTFFAFFPSEGLLPSPSICRCDLYALLFHIALLQSKHQWHAVPTYRSCGWRHWLRQAPLAPTIFSCTPSIKVGCFNFFLQESTKPLFARRAQQPRSGIVEHSNTLSLEFRFWYQLVTKDHSYPPKGLF